MSLSSISNTALSGIQASHAMLGVVADNLANAATPGFKQSQVVLSTQPPTGAPGSQVGTGVQLSAVAADQSQGALLPAAGSTNLAIQGEGYFVLEGPDGQRSYTRDGTFLTNAEGQLVSNDGQRVLGTVGDGSAFQGDLEPLFVLSPRSSGEGTDQLQISSDGAIRRDNGDGTRRQIGRIRLARFNNRDGLRALEGNRFRATASSGPAHITNPGSRGLGRVVAGHREASNVDIAHNLIGMSRAKLLHRANLKVLDVAGEMSDELMNLLRR